jgi:hypothetical protein
LTVDRANGRIGEFEAIRAVSAYGGADAAHHRIAHRANNVRIVPLRSIAAIGAHFPSYRPYRRASLAGSAVDLMEASFFRSFDAVNRDRGEPRGSSPPTPPYIRVRIRRFGGLSLPPCGRTDRGFVSRIAAAASVPAPPGRRASPSGLGGQAGRYRSSAAWPPRDACRYSPLPPFGPSSGRPDYYALC